MLQTAPATWVSGVPLDWTDANLQRFHAACCEAYPTAAAIRAVCECAGIRTSSVNVSSAANYAWRDVLRVAAGSGKLRELLRIVTTDANATGLFAEWRR